MTKCEDCNNYYRGAILNDKVCVGCKVKLRVLYVVMTLNDSSGMWELVTGFYHKLEFAEEVATGMYLHNECAFSSDKQPIINIFYTNDIYGENVNLVSLDNKEVVHIEGGLFENE